MRIVLFSITLIFSVFVHAQSVQQQYLDGKQAFRSADYVLAYVRLEPLVTDKVFGPYASFYAALCQYHQGDTRRALELLGQVQVKYPAFKQMDEVNLWRAYIFLKIGDVPSGVMQANKIDNDSIRAALYAEGLSKSSYKELLSLYGRFPADQPLARHMVTAGLSADLAEGEKDELLALMNEKGLEPIWQSSMPVLKKDSYSIAVLLPFLFEGLEKPEQVVRNTLVMELYQGMELAATMLQESGVKVELLPFDTRRDSTFTVGLLAGKEMENVDLIVGPLLPGPINAVNAFATEKNVNVLNPVSSNGKVIAGSPNTFIRKPSYETQARAAARYMADSARKTEVMIYFENKSPEREIAEAYKSAIEEEGMEVTDFKPLDAKLARELLAQFTSQEEMVLTLNDIQLDSLKKAGRLIRSRPTYDRSGRMITQEDGSPVLEHYELVFTLDTDSLDHIFAVTRSNLFANSFVGMIETKRDSIRLLGLGDWLDFTMLEYTQLERLAVTLIHPDYFDRSNPFYRQVYDRFVSEVKKEPTLFHLLGFESVWWAGHMMHRYGRYFQNGFHEPNDIPSVFYGHQFEPGQNDNQRVPLVRFQNRQLVPVNLKNEDSEQ